MHLVVGGIAHLMGVSIARWHNFSQMAHKCQECCCFLCVMVMQVQHSMLDLGKSFIRKQENVAGCSHVHAVCKPAGDSKVGIGWQA